MSHSRDVIALKSFHNAQTEKRADRIAYLCFAGAAALLCVQAFYGFGFDDESWYTAFAHRMTLGDSLLTDEWHVAQLIGFLLIFASTGIAKYFIYTFIKFLFSSLIEAS